MMIAAYIVAYFVIGVLIHSVMYKFNIIGYRSDSDFQTCVVLMWILVIPIVGLVGCYYKFIKCLNSHLE